MSKAIRTYKSNMRNATLSAVKQILDFVGSTLGPSGRNVILARKHIAVDNSEEYFVPNVTKDGVTVANFIHSDDEFEDAAIQIIKQASEQTNIQAGDGTTTAAILACSIIKLAQKYLYNDGTSPVRFKRGLDHALKLLVSGVKERSTPVKTMDDLQNVAYISTNNDKEMSEIVTRAVSSVGRDGAVKIELSKGNETSLEVMEGFRLRSGLAGMSFVTDERRKVCNYDDAYVLIYDGTIDEITSIQAPLELAAHSRKPIIVVADNFEPNVLALMLTNFANGKLRVAPIKAPYYGDERRNLMSDLAVSTGATFISKLEGRDLASVELTDLGKVSSFEASKFVTTFVNGQGLPEKIEERLAEIDEEYAAAKERAEGPETLERIEERGVRLSSAVAVIYIGAYTESELEERKHRFEDALAAVQSAQEEGIVAGGGTTLLTLSSVLKKMLDSGEFDVLSSDEKAGVHVLSDALLEPLKRIADNAGSSGEAIIAVLEDKEYGEGYDFAKREYVNMLEAGIIDPAKVTRVSLENAVSAAGILLTANHCIVRHNAIETSKSSNLNRYMN